MKQQAKNKIEAKIYSLKFEIQKLNNEVSMGISPGVTIKETYDTIDRLNSEIRIHQYILKQLN